MGCAVKVYAGSRSKTFWGIIMHAAGNGAVDELLMKIRIVLHDLPDYAWLQRLFGCDTP